LSPRDNCATAWSSSRPSKKLHETGPKILCLLGPEDDPKQNAAWPLPCGESINNLGRWSPRLPGPKMSPTHVSRWWWSDGHPVSFGQSKPTPDHYLWTLGSLPSTRGGWVTAQRRSSGGPASEHGRSSRRCRHHENQSRLGLGWARQTLVHEPLMSTAAGAH
jgi:hypothetical protein